MNIFGLDLIQFSQTAGPITALLIVAAIIFAENGLLIGFFFPGDSLLFTIGFLAQGTSLDLNIHLVVITLFIAAVTGSNLGYAFGKRFGHRLFQRPNSLLFRQENVQKAQAFYDVHGGKTIIVARFIPVVRTFVPLIAGIAKMDFKTFMIFNIIGGLIWTASITYLGFFLGKLLGGLGIDIDTILLPIVAIILIASLSPAIYQFLKNESQRKALWNATKTEIKKFAHWKK
jgi:membrane-associated protein